MRGAGAEQISILVCAIVESKASSTVLRYFYGIGYKLDHEILKVGFAFRFQRGAQFTVIVTSANKMPKLHATDEAVQVTPRSRMLDYNVLGGKCNRGLSVIDSYKTLKGVDVLSKEETFLACTLGWCIEWLQAYFLVLDDIMDNSETRRGQPCWFRVPQVGLIAVNDGIILRNHISWILQRHFRGKPYYVDLIDLFNEVEFKTASGKLLDLITTHKGEKDLTKYNLNVWSASGLHGCLACSIMVLS
ncbi:farnesyl pyrophosphate synthase [Hordeum vulgare]|nr:farnesyl pyrophosphate synthase [Hordeum vulgare]